MLIGGNGQALLRQRRPPRRHRRSARSRPDAGDGHSHEVKWSMRHLDEQIEQVRAGAGERFDDIEFNAMVQVVQITDDRRRPSQRCRAGRGPDDGGRRPRRRIS